MIVDRLKAFLYASGLLGAWHRLRNRDTLTVVMYHRVLARDDPRWASSDPDYTLSDELFARTVRFLKRHYHLVGVGQVIAARRGEGKLPPRALLITFDDGWADNVDHALPVLRAENAPALLFVVADAVGRDRPFFQEELVAAWRSGRLGVPQARALARAIGAADPGEAPEGLGWLRTLIAALEALPPAERESALAPYAAILRDGIRHMVSAEELARWRSGAIALGLHGKTHTPMTKAADVDAELDGARQALARLLSVPAQDLATLSFPHGRWTPAIVQRARDFGYQLMFTSVPGLNAVGAGVPDVLARVGIETESATDGEGRFRPERLALGLFRGPVKRLVV